MGLPSSVYIRELGPREGFQTVSHTIPTEHKLELIEALSQTGVKEIEITSLVRPDRVPQMADAEEVIRTFKKHPGIRYTALYLNRKGFERAESIGKDRIDCEAWLYFAASETFFKRNNNSTLAEALGGVPEWVNAFRAAGKPVKGVMISTAFGCMYEGAVSARAVGNILDQITRELASYGEKPQEISLADTVGMANPETVRELVTMVKNRYPAAEVSLHLHDTRGTGIANVYAGLLAGVRIFDGSVGGMGGCPFTKGAAGNVATEDVVYLCESLGIDTGISLARYVEAARLAEKIVGHTLPGKYMRAIT